MRAALILSLSLSLLLAAAPASAEPCDRAGRIADFAPIRHAITRQPPNPAWAAERGFDLPAPDRPARAGLEAAPDHAAARAALAGFRTHDTPRQRVGRLLSALPAAYEKVSARAQ
jgi:hypothetical protein